MTTLPHVYRAALLGLFAVLTACSQSGPTLAPTALPVRRAEFSLSTLPSERVMVALAFGQSNAANSGDVRGHGGEHVYNFFRGKLYEAQDPLLGATGDGGSVWTRLRCKLIDGNEYDAVVFVSVGVSGSAIARWTPGGNLHPRVVGAIRDLKARGLDVTHLLWHQGEADNLLGTSQDAYRERFLRLLGSVRSQGVDAPIYVSTATRYKSKGPNEELRQAQLELVDAARGVVAGPDTDALGGVYRYDGTHFNDDGLDAFADLWLEKLGSAGVKTPQHITFDLSSVGKKGEAAFSVAEHASASSGLGVRFSSRNTASCTVFPDGTVTPIAAGPCTLRASQTGDATYAAATPVEQTLTVSREPTLGPPTDLYVMNFGETPTGRLIYGVGLGNGIVHRTGTNPKASSVPVVAQPHRGGSVLKSQQARVVGW